MEHKITTLYLSSGCMEVTHRMRRQNIFCNPPSLDFSVDWLSVRIAVAEPTDNDVLMGLPPEQDGKSTEVQLFEF